MNFLREQIKTGAVEGSWIIYRDAMGREVMRVKLDMPLRYGDVIRIPPEITFED